MKKLKMGTPMMGVAIGAALVAVAVLIMIIGFWKTLILLALFGIGYFLGTVENKQEFVKNAANKVIPEKEAKVIDLKSEIARDQEARQAETEEVPDPADKEDDKNEDGQEDGE